MQVGSDSDQEIEERVDPRIVRKVRKYIEHINFCKGYDFDSLHAASVGTSYPSSNPYTLSHSFHFKYDTAYRVLAHTIQDVLDDTDIWEPANGELKSLLDGDGNRTMLCQLIESLSHAELRELLTKWAVTRIKVVIQPENTNYSPYWCLHLRFEVHCVSSSLAEGGIAHLNLNDVYPYNYSAVKMIMLSSFINSIKLD
jgi:hypothetical protein